jgi:hypothetical protein
VRTRSQPVPLDRSSRGTEDIMIVFAVLPVVKYSIDERQRTSSLSLGLLKNLASNTSHGCLFCFRFGQLRRKPMAGTKNGAVLEELPLEPISREMEVLTECLHFNGVTTWAFISMGRQRHVLTGTCLKTWSRRR